MSCPLTYKGGLVCGRRSEAVPTVGARSIIMMDRRHLFEGLVVLWIFASVIEVTWSEIVKRDVHRIILKSARKPRSHRNHHHHHHRGRGHGHKHYYDDSRERDNSFEDSRYYHSLENSYEEPPPKYKNSFYHHKSKSRPPSTSFLPNIEVDEVRLEGYRDDWTPLLSAENKVLHPHTLHPPSHHHHHHEPISHHHHEPLSHHHHETSSSTGRHKPQKKDKRHRHQRNHSKPPKRNNPQLIELTTSFPSKAVYPTLFETTDFPPFAPDVFKNFHQKTIDSKQSPMVRVTKVFAKFPNIKSFNTSYEVHEDHRHDKRNPLEDQTSFNVLGPALAALSNTRTMPQESRIKQVAVMPPPPLKKQEEEKKKTEKKPIVRARGRVRMKN